MKKRRNAVAMILVSCLLATSVISAYAASAKEEAAIVQADLVQGAQEGRYANTIAYKENWYEDTNFTTGGLTSYREVVNRAVFGEAPNWIADKQAVALTIFYRRASGAADSLYDVATAPGQFAAIVGGAGETEAARCPKAASNWTAKWDNCAAAVGAVWGTVLAGSENPAEAMTIPKGYAGQLYFRSPGTFFGIGISNPVTDRTKTHAYDNGSQAYLVSVENGTVTVSPIKDICVPGVGCYQTVAAAQNDLTAAVESDFLSTADSIL